MSGFVANELSAFGAKREDVLRVAEGELPRVGQFNVAATLGV